MLLTVSFSLAPVLARIFGFAMLDCAAAIGRPFLTRAAPALHTVSISFLMILVLNVIRTATTGYLFGLSKGSPNSERMLAHSIL